MIGYSAGGYFTARAAAFDKRIKALISNSPLRDMHAMFTAVFPKVLLARRASSIVAYVLRHFPNESIRTSIELVLWEAGMDSFLNFVELTKQASLAGIEKNISCPTLALCGEGEGRVFLEQAETFIRNISAAKKELKIFTRAEGASAHCQIDNLTLARNTICDWLDSIVN